MTYPFYKPIAELDYRDLEALIGEEENKTVDFKQDAYSETRNPKDKNEWKREFCKDISALANANGGWIFCGVREEEGKAVEIVGLGPNLDPDKEVLRLQQCADSGIEPRLSRLEIRPINLPDPAKKVVVAIHVARSFIAPHRSTQNYKFYMRRFGGVQEMDIAEIRQAFNYSSSFEDKVRLFRKQRVEAISSGEHEDIPIALDRSGYAVVIHLIPLTFGSLDSRVDIFAAGNPNLKWFENFSGDLPSARFNFDGFVIASHNYAYLQVFRNGAVEQVVLGEKETYKILKNRNYVLLPSLQKSCLLELTHCINVAEELHIEPPFFVMVSLLRMKGLNLVRSYDKTDIDILMSDQPPIKRSNLIMPEVFLEKFDEDPTKILRPVFDVLWNVAGFDRCPDYDLEGNWIDADG